MFRASSHWVSNYCWALFRCLNCAQRFDYRALGSSRKQYDKNLWQKQLHHYCSVTDLNALDFKACIAVQTSRLTSLQNLQFNYRIKYGSILRVEFTSDGNQYKTIKMLKYVFEWITCSTISHFPSNSDQLRKSETTNLEKKYRKERKYGKCVKWAVDNVASLLNSSRALWGGASNPVYS